MGNGIIPVEIICIHPSFGKLDCFHHPETYNFNFSSGNLAKFKMAVVMVNHGKCLIFAF